MNDADMAVFDIQKYFKAYDVRGIVDDCFNPHWAYWFGRGLAEVFAEANHIVIARDGRSHSRDMLRGVVTGLLEYGKKVDVIYPSTTPMLYAAVGQSGADLGIMVTASHNPGPYNGFKVCGKEAKPMGRDDALYKVALWMESNVKACDITYWDGDEKDWRPSYYSFLNSTTMAPNEQSKPLKIVVDAGNGMGYSVLGDWLENNPKLDVTALYTEVDFHNPVHEANPLVMANVLDLQKKVLELNADFGFALDGDGDRVVFIDEQGQMFPSDLLLASMMHLFVTKNEPSVICDIRASRKVMDEGKNLGADVYRVKAGHSFIKKYMREHNANIGGELSGHLYFKETYFADSSAFAFLTVWRLLNEYDYPLSHYRKKMVTYATSGEQSYRLT